MQGQDSNLRLVGLSAVRGRAPRILGPLDDPARFTRRQFWSPAPTTVAELPSSLLFQLTGTAATTPSLSNLVPFAVIPAPRALMGPSC